MNNCIDLNGKTALITGATRGIGKAIANNFIEVGANVLLTGTNKSNIALLNAENENPKVKWFVADFSTLKGIELFISKLEKTKNIKKGQNGNN